MLFSRLAGRSTGFCGRLRQRTDNEEFAMPDEQITTYEQAIRTLEEEIVLGILHGGQRLVEDDLLARFSLKRHVIRQLFVDLERMGLVERKRNVGAQVRSFTAKQVQDLYAVRILLETECARLIPLPVGVEALAELKSIQALHDSSVRLGDLRAAFRANMRLHERIFSLVDNPFLVAAIEHHAKSCHSIRSYSLMIPEQMERARQEHWAMIDALAEGNREKLITLCATHLVPAREIYLRICNQRTQHFSTDQASSEHSI